MNAGLTRYPPSTEGCDTAAGGHNVSMEFLGWLAMLAVFLFAANRCGKSIDKRDWGEAVTEFLGALGMVLILVRKIPPF